ncbi:MAG TPA: hypothetical protein VFC46_11465 [Humisphaera sp.]|nr:hypothetical protein [Humisphaera sp.]
MNYRLQPLRIPIGWTIEYNDGLYEIDPDSVATGEDDELILFKEDMVQMKHQRRDRLLDIGWRPSGNVVEGSYWLVVYQGDFRGRLLFEFCTRDRLQLVTVIERLLEDVSEGRL